MHQIGSSSTRVMAIGATTERYHRSLAVFAHVLGVTAIILMLVWLLHFRGGIDLNSDNTDLVFNVCLLYHLRMFKGMWDL